MDIRSPKQRWQLKFEGSWPTSVAFLGNSRVAAGNREGQIFVWDLSESPPQTADAKQQSPPDLAPVRRLDGHANGVSHLVATSDGALISSSLDRTIRIWDANATPGGTADVVLDVAQRQRQARNKPQAERAAILNSPGVTVDTIAPVAALPGHVDWVVGLGISGDQRRLISGDTTSLVIVWDLAGRREIARWNGHPWNGAIATALSPDGQTALVSEFSYKRDDFDIPAAALKLWSVSEAAEKLDLLQRQFPKLDASKSTYGAAQVWRKFVAGGLIAADFSPDGKLLAVGQGGETDTGKVHLLDAESGELLRSIAGHRYGVCDLCFSADGRYLISSGRDTTIRICQVSDGNEVAALGKPRGGQFKDWIHAIAVSPDQAWIAAADIAGMVHLWQLRS